MECTTASAPSRNGAYDAGCRRSAFSQRTDEAQLGGVAEEVMEGQCGEPLREREVTVQCGEEVARRAMREPVGLKGGRLVCVEKGEGEG